MNAFQDAMQHYPLLKQFAGGLCIAFFGYWLMKYLARYTGRLFARAGVDGILSAFTRNLVFILGLILVFVLALDYMGVASTSILAVLGTAGLAIGLALKDSLSNIASGFMLILLRPFQIGDTVQIANLEGVIEQVKVFQTHLHTLDNRHIILPNSLITAAPIINLTSLEKRRVEINFRVNLTDSVSAIREKCLQMASSNSHVLSTPKSDVLSISLIDSHMELQWRFWVKAEFLQQTKSDLLEQLASELHKESMQ